MELVASRKAWIALLVALCMLCCVALASAAGATTAGTIPPSNPKSDCSASTVSWTETGIDYCRSLERVGPLTLPSNWSALTVPERMLVVLDLERVNRGLTPVVGLSKTLDTLAQKGAANYRDPGFPSVLSFTYGGSIWGETGSVIEADYGWMYEDGAGSGSVNQACTSTAPANCWIHRDVILMNRPGTIVGGAGYTNSSYTFELLAGYSTQNLSFTWASELKYFSVAPGLEPLTVPAVTAVSPAKGSVHGGTTVTITGNELQSLTAVDFGSSAGTGLNCTSNEQCSVRTPAHVAGKVAVTAVNAAGRSVANKAAAFSYAS